MSRFDYVKYDVSAISDQETAKKQCAQLEALIESITGKAAGRAKALAITKLEETYMWIGKAIRDSQIERNGTAATNLQEERTNS